MKAIPSRLPLNVLWYDENIFNSENAGYQNELFASIDGLFIPCANGKLLKGIMANLAERGQHRLVVITSGSASSTVLEAVADNSYVQAILVFCFELSKWQHLSGTQKVVGVYNNFSDVVTHLTQESKAAVHTSWKNDCPVVPIDFYDSKLRALHRMLASANEPNYQSPAIFHPKLDAFQNFCIASGVNDKSVADMIAKLKQTADERAVVQPFLQTYTGETQLCYFGNYTLRRCIEREYEGIQGYVGTLMYSVKCTVKTNPKARLAHSTTLYRGLNLDFVRLNDYYMNRGSIVCFPAFTSTSSNPSVIKNFPTVKAKEMDKLQTNITHMYIAYEYRPDIANHNPLQVTKATGLAGESEVLFNAFSFFRIQEVEFGEGTTANPNKIMLEYIHPECDLEVEVAKGKSLYYDAGKNLICPR